MVERIIGVIPLSYYLSSLLLVALALIMALVSRYLNTGDFRQAFFFYTGSWARTGVLVLENMLPFYALWAVRYMGNMVSSNQSLISLAPENEKTLTRLFSSASSPLPPILIAISLGVPFSLNNSAEPNIIEPYTRVVWPITILFILLVYGTFWVFFSLIHGLYRFGKEPPRLTLPQLDNSLGLSLWATSL